MREYFLFYRSFFEAISALPTEAQAEIYNAIGNYALNDIAPANISPLAQSIFTLVKPIIDKANRLRENGKKGGAPKGNKNSKPKRNQETTKAQPKDNQIEESDNQKTTHICSCYNIVSNTNVLSTNSNNNKDVDLNKININNNKVSDVVDAGVVVEKFLKEIFKKDFVSRACTALSIPEKEYNQHAQAIVAEWQVSGIENFLPENSPTQHLLNQMRIKRDSPSERKAQASASTQARVRRDAEERKRKEEQERNEVRGSVSLEEWRRSKGLAEGESILSLLHRPTEAEALAEFHTLNPN